MTNKTFTALDQIADRMDTASKAAADRRDAAATREKASHVDGKSYRMGEASAYNEAHKIMAQELRRLRNLMQNGALTTADFGVEW